jgi:plasmid stability protein
MRRQESCPGVAHWPGDAWKMPRVSVVLERPLYEALRWLARRDGVSLSTKMRDVLRKALETHENLALTEIAAERERSLGRTTRALTRDAVWGSAPRSAQPRR